MPTLNTPTNPMQSSSPLTALGQPSNATDPLANLRDIHLPADVSGLPLAPGWWLLALLIIATLVAVGAWCYQQHRRQQYRREAVRLLSSLENESHSAHDSLQALNALLKRVALHAYPTAALAACHGQPWTDFLQRSAPHLEQPVEVAALLQSGPYRPAEALGVTAENLTACYGYSRQWLEKHLTEAKLPPLPEARHAAS